MQAFIPLGDVIPYSIKTYDIDHKKQATPVALIRAMHEAAMQNVIRLGISVWDLEPHSLTWVLMSKYVEFKRFPKLNEKVKIITYPAGFERVFTYRDYKIVDESGALLLSCASTWLLMDTNSRKMTRIPDFIKILEANIPKEEMCLPRCKVKFDELEAIERQQKIQVGWYDLDFNGHTNNVQYVRWMLESLGSWLKGNQLQQLEIQFRAECYWQDQLVAVAQQQGDHCFSHQLVKEEDGKVLASARTFWK